MLGQILHQQYQLIIAAIYLQKCIFLNGRQIAAPYLPLHQRKFLKKYVSLMLPKPVAPSVFPQNSLFVSKPLEKIFNLSFSNGTVPNQFKVARVIPIFKKSSQICPENYRPISLLSIFNRFLETLMSRRITEFLNNNNLISKKQSRFRSSHSTFLPFY